jgi:MoaA/NifB/PqqE/SkfB family radical SAM enzyme
MWVILHMIINQYRLSLIRKTKTTDAFPIPPYLIFSITKQCNLSCKGCYAKIHQSDTGAELTTLQAKNIFEQAQELGIGIIMLAGGEPLTRPDIINSCKEYPEIIFPLFTNGVLLSAEYLHSLADNVVTVLSIEGNQMQTDSRRGDEVYRLLKERFKCLHKSTRYWGVSITVTNENINEILADSFVHKLVRHGCNLFFFVEYVPINPDTEHLILSPADKAKLSLKTDEFSRKYPGLFIEFPGDEEKWGGCLAAGRGFVHIQADGSLEPCPFAPYSDISLKDVSLADALKSKFLSEIRKKHHLLHETKGGCALWENRDLVKQILENQD